MIAREKVLKKMENLGEKNSLSENTRNAWYVPYDSNTTLYANQFEILMSHENLSESYELEIPSEKMVKVFHKGLNKMKEEEKGKVVVPKKIIEEACKCKRKVKRTLGFGKETYGITFYNSNSSMPLLNFNPEVLKNMMDWAGVKPSGDAIVEIPFQCGFSAKVFNAKDPTYEAYSLGLYANKEHYGDKIKHDTNFYAVFVEFNPEKIGIVKDAFPAGYEELTVKSN